MPDDRDNRLFDRECPTCGHEGMKKTQVPAPNEPDEAYKCPECGAIDTDEDDITGSYVQKR